MELFIYFPRSYSIEAILWAFPIAQLVKNLPAMQEIQVRSLGREDPLEKEMAVHSSILAWRIPRTEEPGGLQSTGSQRGEHDWATSLSLSCHLISDTNNTSFMCHSSLREQWLLHMEVTFVHVCVCASWVGAGCTVQVPLYSCWVSPI